MRYMRPCSGSRCYIQGMTPFLTTDNSKMLANNWMIARPLFRHDSRGAEGNAHCCAALFFFPRMLLLGHLTLCILSPTLVVFSNLALQNGITARSPIPN